MKRVTDPLRILICIGLILVADGWNDAYYRWTWFRNGVKVLLVATVVALLVQTHVYGVHWVSSTLLAISISIVGISIYQFGWNRRLQAACSIASCISQICFNHMVRNKLGEYPTVNELRSMMPCFPENPFGSGDAARVIVDGFDASVTIHEAGWMYNWPKPGDVTPILPSMGWWPSWLTCPD